MKILQDGARERRTLTRIQEGASSAASIFMTPMTSPFCSTSPPTHPFPSPHPYPQDVHIHLLLIQKFPIHFYHLTIHLLLLHSHLFIHLIPIHFYLLLHLHNPVFHFHLLLPHLLIHLHLLLLRIQVDLDQDAPQLASSISSFSE